MQIPIPVGLIAIFISLSLFYYFNQKARIRREARRQERKQVQDDFLQVLLTIKTTIQ